LPVDVVDGLEDWHHDLATATGREVRPDDAVFPALGHKGCFLKGSAKASPLLALGRETISVVCKHLMADAGISGARYAAHAMRATAATLAYLGSQGHGASMDDIQAMLHHSKQETTRRYIKLTEHRASAAVVWIPSTKLKRADSAAGTQKDAA
jgi:integrase